MLSQVKCMLRRFILPPPLPPLPHRAPIASGHAVPGDQKALMKRQQLMSDKRLMAAVTKVGAYCSSLKQILSPLSPPNTHTQRCAAPSTRALSSARPVFSYAPVIAAICCCPSLLSPHFAVLTGHKKKGRRWVTKEQYIRYYCCQCCRVEEATRVEALLIGS